MIRSVLVLACLVAIATAAPVNEDSGFTARLAPGATAGLEQMDLSDGLTERSRSSARRLGTQFASSIQGKFGDSRRRRTFYDRRRRRRTFYDRRRRRRTFYDRRRRRTFYDRRRRRRTYYCGVLTNGSWSGYGAWAAWGSYGNWSVCNANGDRWRVRYRASYRSCTGASCGGANTVGQSYCPGSTGRSDSSSLHSNIKVHCAQSAWTLWSACTKSCGGGSQTRTRSITVAASCGGNGCGHAAETQGCSPGPCPVHCATSAFAPWSVCTKSCGGGAQSRSRTVTEVAQHGGYVCPYLEETRNCNTGSCSVDGTVGSWASWSPCTKSCGSGSTKRSRPFVAPLFGGKPNAHSAETKACNVPSCPTPVPTPAPDVKSAAEAKIIAKQPVGSTKCSHVSCEVICDDTTKYDANDNSPVATPKCRTFMYDYHASEQNGDTHHCLSDLVSQACLCFCGQLGATKVTHNALHASRAVTRTIAGKM